MLYDFKAFAARYFNFWIRLARLKSKIVLLPIDFHKHWMFVIWNQRFYAIASLVGITINYVFYTLLPIFIGVVIARKTLDYLGYVLFAACIVHCCDFLVNYWLSILDTQSVYSTHYNAHLFFLTVDPIYHTLQKRGRIIGKVERGARSFEYLIDVFSLEFFPIIIAIITAIIACSFYGLFLGLVALLFITAMIIFNMVLQFFTTITFEREGIKVEDSLKEVSSESLSQNQLIRACFASNELNERLIKTSKTTIVVEGTAWAAFNAVDFITKLIYIVSLFTLAYLILQRISDGAMSVIDGTSLLITYVIGTQDVVRIGKYIKYLLRYTSRISDLFLFIRGFGKQTFPVLSADIKSHGAVYSDKHHDPIEIVASSIYFEYGEKAKIFKGHSLNLSVPLSQQNKLYGIIGPSGIGKTTLMGVLGGLLKPTSGTVLVNGIDLYAVDDNIRKTLIALQGQISSSLSGSVRSSLLIGLPTHSVPYHDDELIEVLSKVGLWNLFKNKKGLDEIIGEGATNLSGGQRQRLNFASLYLRSRFFKPLLILIDEPTSSLDQESEHAITDMIATLATDSVTFVIAHRLKTIEQACGILDFLMLKTEKDIVFLTPEELEGRSDYYKKLVAGELTLDK